MQKCTRIITSAGVAALTILGSTSIAVAGEINGKGERPMVVQSIPLYDENGDPILNPVTGEQEFAHILHGKSECAFSGLNDEYLSEKPTEGPASDGFGRTQNWGQLPKEVRDVIGALGAHPGDSCNPSKSGPVEP